MLMSKGEAKIRTLPVGLDFWTDEEGNVATLGSTGAGPVVRLGFIGIRRQCSTLFFICATLCY